MEIKPTISLGSIGTDQIVSKLKATVPEKPQVLEVPGDKVELQGSKAATAAAAKPSAPAPDIVVLKDKGLDALVDSINEAQKSIDLKIYMIDTSEPRISQALKGALNRGVKVRLMVEDDPFYWEKPTTNPSEKAIEEFVKAGAEYKPDNPKFSKNCVTHEKSLVIDGKKAIVLTGNLRSSTFTKNLDLGAIIIRNQKVVDQVEEVFNADWERTPLPNLKETGLVISPDNAREEITNLIKGAKSSIHIIQQSLTDREMVKLLADKSKKGVEVEALLANPALVQNNMQPAAYLALNGTKVRFLEAPYIHAKALVVDNEKPDKEKSFVGSQNFTQPALDRNREMGYIFSDQKGQVEKIYDEYTPKAYALPDRLVISENASVGSAMRSALHQAEKNITIETNLFSDKIMINMLSDAVARGLEVKVIMPKNPFPWDPSCDLNLKTAEALKKAGVQVHWSDSTNAAVQGTIMTMDGKEAIISTDNLSRTAFNDNQIFGVININQAEVAEAQKVLDADFAGKPKPISIATDGMVISPLNAREKLVNLIKGAQGKIDMQTRRLNDRQIVAVLKDKAQAGIPVRVIIEDRDNMPAWEKEIINDLRSAGAEVELISAVPLRNNFINVDDKKAYMGSHEMSKDSLDNTRGFGSIVDEPHMMSIGQATFEENWVMASIDQASKSLLLEKKEIHYRQDRPVLDVLEERAKYGVKVDIHIGEPTDEFLKVEVDNLNQQLVEVAKMDPVRDKDAIASFYGLKYKPEQALEAQKKLQKALKGLGSKGRLIEVKYKDPAKIKQDFVQADDRKIILPSYEKPDDDGADKTLKGDKGSISDYSLISNSAQI
jgi:phosphatidylserine/phosphatidylglycerophosphate/cardiolipin synthase-like enzyme